eukprot:8209593-Lingulodinium_polyedra.AAC.1
MSATVHCGTVLPTSTAAIRFHEPPVHCHTCPLNARNVGSAAEVGVCCTGSGARWAGPLTASRSAFSSTGSLNAGHSRSADVPDVAGRR